MAWIPHIMILGEDAEALEVWGLRLVDALARAIGSEPKLAPWLRPDTNPADQVPLTVKVTTHGFQSPRLTDLPVRSPHHVRLHLVRERPGRLERARRLLNEQLFAVVVSDLRLGPSVGSRSGRPFVEDAARIHPEIEGIPATVGHRETSSPFESASRLADRIVRALISHLDRPSVSAFVQALIEEGLVYQSDAFGTTLAQLFDRARLLGQAGSVPSKRRSNPARRALPCLLIDGESGTGKRGLASLFHAISDRRDDPLTIASCSELTNQTLLRSILFGHKRGAFTDAREDRIGLIGSAGRGVLLLDDFHRLPGACSSIFHSFLEDGQYSRLGEEEIRRRAEAAVVLTVESEPWRQRTDSGELSPAFLARVERLPLQVPPLRDRPEDIIAQAQWMVAAMADQLSIDIALNEDALQGLGQLPFTQSNSRELRNLVEQAVLGTHRESDQIGWDQIEPLLHSPQANSARNGTTAHVPGFGHRLAHSVRIGRLLDVSSLTAAPTLNDWQRRLRKLAARIAQRRLGLETEAAETLIARLFDETLPELWPLWEQARRTQLNDRPEIPLPLWEDLFRCFAVHRQGGPTPAEPVLGIPANTLRQWINDRETR